MRKNKVAFTIVVSEQEDAKITELTKALLCSKAAVIRKAVNAMYNHESGWQFTCADGRPCMVPQMHPPRKIRLPEHAEIPAP